MEHLGGKVVLVEVRYVGLICRCLVKGKKELMKGKVGIRQCGGSSGRRRSGIP